MVFRREGTYGLVALIVALFASALFTDAAWAQAALTVTKSDSPDPVEEGETLTYNIVVTNNDPNGNASANNVVISDDLPATTDFTQVQTTQGTCPTQPAEGAPNTGSPDVSCNLGTLADGASATVTIQVEPTGAAVGTQITNQAVGTCGPACADDNSPTIQTTVLPDLEINKLSDPDPVDTGDVLLYTISLTNQGSIDIPAANLDVVDFLPLDEVDLVSIESNDFDCDPPTPTTSFNAILPRFLTPTKPLPCRSTSSRR
jgi:uncharacterized repeat protein (TIGR01451 family)